MGRKSLESKGIVTKDRVHSLYITRSLGVRACARELDISIGTFYNYLKRYNIPRRNRGSRSSL
jgi:transposase